MAAKDPIWLAAYTVSRHEKSVIRHLEVREIECFLPVYKSLRKWKNGCKTEIEFPVFPNYVFVHVDRKLPNRVLEYSWCAWLCRLGEAACASSRRGD